MKIKHTHLKILKKEKRKDQYEISDNISTPK